MQTGAELDRLRRRLTVLYTATAAVGLVALATITTTVEGRLRADRTDQELLGWASRAASLVDDATGSLDPAAIEDDVIHERVEWSAFASDAGVLVEIGASRQLVGASELAARSVLDEDERGTVGDVLVGGERRRAAAMPLFVDDAVAGAVVAAALPDRGGSQLARSVWVATIGLITFGGLAGWWLAGRSIRPAAASIEHHEQFLAVAAHELRTPLARVRAVGESVGLLATDHSADGDELASEVARLQSLTGEASLAVEQLLLIARVDAGSVRVASDRFRLDELAVASASDHPSVEVVVPGPLVVVADRTLLALAISNLLANAERHCGLGSAHPSITLTVAAWADGVTIRVADNGPGFADADIPRVFDRFRSGARDGVGLGLWLVRWIAEQHGGSVLAENAASGGAVVTVAVPSVGRPVRDSSRDPKSNPR